MIISSEAAAFVQQVGLKRSPVASQVEVKLRVRRWFYWCEHDWVTGPGLWRVKTRTLWHLVVGFPSFSWRHLYFCIIFLSRGWSLLVLKKVHCSRPPPLTQQPSCFRWVLKDFNRFCLNVIILNNCGVGEEQNSTNQSYVEFLNDFWLNVGCWLVLELRLLFCSNDQEGVQNRMLIKRLFVGPDRKLCERTNHFSLCPCTNFGSVHHRMCFHVETSGRALGWCFSFSFG